MGISPLQLIRHPDRERLIDDARIWIKAVDEFLRYRFTENNLYVKVDLTKEESFQQLPKLSGFLIEVLRCHYQKFGWRVDCLYDGSRLSFYPKQLYDLV